MQLAVIGTGNVGGTLGRRWAKAGHDVIFGVRNPSEPKVVDLVQDIGPNANAILVSECARQAPVVVLTVPWEGAQDALRKAGNLRDKILIDATNPVAMNPDGLRQGLVIGHTTSGAEQIAHWADGARVV